MKTIFPLKSAGGSFHNNSVAVFNSYQNSKIAYSDCTGRKGLSHQSLGQRLQKYPNYITL